MAQLIVRNLNEGVIRRLKVRAAQNGRSAEAEHRELLKTALLAPRSMKSLKDLLLAMPEAGEDGDFEPSSGPDHG
jgi:plasmid stability protein